MNADPAVVLPATAIERMHRFGERTGLRLRPLGPNDLDALFGLHRAVIDSLPSPELFAEDPSDYFARHLGQEGLSFGAFADAMPVGYSTLRFPKSHSDNLGRDLGLPVPELSHVAHLESAGVLPAFRGIGVNAVLNGLCIETAETLGFRHIAATVAPANLPSVRAKIRDGMFGKVFSRKYDIGSRIVFHRDGRVAPKPLTPSESVRATDERKVANAFEQGLWVVGATLETGAPFLCFARRAAA